MIFPQLAMGQRIYLSEAGLDGICFSSIEISLENKGKCLGAAQARIGLISIQISIGNQEKSLWAG